MDMKAEMGSSRKAMIRSGISFDKLPNEQKQKDTSTNGRQKSNFAGMAKKRNRKDRVAQRSLVAVEEKDSVSDSYEDTQPEFGGVAIVNKPQKYLRPRIINAHSRMAGMKRHDFDCIQQIKESNSRPRVRRRHAPDDDIDFYFLRVTNFFSLRGCSRIQIFPL